MRKIKTHLKFGILLLGVSLFFVNCEKETDVLLENDSLYKTASKDEIISSLNFNKSISAKGTAPYVTFNVDEAQLEDIKNTSAKLTVIPAKTKNENLYSRVLFLKVNDTVKGVVFNMHSNIKNKKGRFSGEITVNSLDGDLLKAFRVHNGHLNSVYNNNPSKKSSTNKSAQLFNKTEDDDGAECREVCGHPADDENCLCNMQWLDEVVVTAPSEIPVEGYYEIDIYYFFYSLYGDNSSYNINETQYIDPYDWVYQDEGGGGVENDGTNNIVSVEEQNLTRICSDYQWKEIGVAQYANISNLYLIIVAKGIFSDQVIEVDLGELCISIPYASSRAATNIFNDSWENAKKDLYNAMSNDSRLLNDTSATISFRDFLINRLKNDQVGSTLSTRPCGNTPSTPAKYCL